ncbi:MAG: TetR/AcrR family transcriptional regulator [Alphaproteobacteria bacterium]
MPAMTEHAQAEATRAMIRAHALELFSHYGFQKTNIGDIAKQAGMSPGNLYRFYKNKHAIGIAVVAAYFAMVEVEMDLALKAAPADNAEARICAFIETGIAQLAEELERNPKIVELAEFVCEDEGGMEILHAHISWKRARVAREIEAGVAEGILKAEDPEALAATLLNALKAFWMPMTLAQWQDRTTILPELRAILDLVFVGLRA